MKGRKMNVREMVRNLPKGRKEALKLLQRAALDTVVDIDWLYNQRGKKNAASDVYLNECIELVMNKLHKLELDMQLVIGLPQDPAYHTWWMRPKCCTCPKMDNLDPAYFGGGRIINSDCPLHGKTVPITRSLS